VAGTTAARRFVDGQLWAGCAVVPLADKEIRRQKSAVVGASTEDLDRLQQRDWGASAPAQLAGLAAGAQ
jgi:hypothetical protein